MMMLVIISSIGVSSTVQRQSNRLTDILQCVNNWQMCVAISDTWQDWSYSANLYWQWFEGGSLWHVMDI